MAPENMDTYAYTPLPSYHPTAFRTLELLPGLPSDTLEGRLRNHVDESATYDALSYVWGQDGPSSEYIISLEGRKLEITPSLHNALRRLRLQDKPRVLWADSICINQADKQEKSRQVSRMKLYYQYAEKVIIYLGEEADESEKVPAVIDMVHEKLFGPIKAAYPTAALDGIDPPPQDTLLKLGFPPSGTSEWNALGKLFKRPWWSRYWIIQELVQAPKAELVCGRWTCDWDRFALAVRATNQHPKYHLDEGGENVILDQVKRGERHLANLHMLRQSVERKQIRAISTNLDGSETPLTIHQCVPQWSLIDLMERCRQSQATDPRDYIYAMAGMSTEEARGRLRGITPNYDEDANETFVRYARSMVDWGDGVKLLYSAASGSTFSPDLPSWVPNWSDRNPQAWPLSPRYDGAINHYYKAALGRPAHIRLSTVSDHMILRGIMVDTIAEVGSVTYRSPVAGGFSVFQRDFDVVAESATELIGFLEQRRKEAEPEEIFNAVWRTLCCNVDKHSGNQASEFTGNLFRAMLPWLKWWLNVQPERQAATDPQLFTRLLGARLLALIEETSPFLMSAAPQCLGRRVAVTVSGLCAQVPGKAKAGDVVFLPLGSAVPFVLRMDLDGYVLQGECYVENIMDGEMLRKADTKTEEVTIV